MCAESAARIKDAYAIGIQLLPFDALARMAQWLTCAPTGFISCGRNGERAQ